jgi:hypothetical protein
VRSKFDIYVFISITSVGGQLLIERIIRPEVSVSALTLIITVFRILIFFHFVHHLFFAGFELSLKKILTAISEDIIKIKT